MEYIYIFVFMKYIEIAFYFLLVENALVVV